MPGTRKLVETAMIEFLQENKAVLPQYLLPLDNGGSVDLSSAAPRARGPATRAPKTARSPSLRNSVISGTP